MRWSTNELSYCSNVHSGESLQEVIYNLNRFIGSVQFQAGSSSLNTGLWLSNKASQELGSFANNRQLLKKVLINNHLTLNTLNGFPFGDFHQEVIKEAVYLPDWTEDRRFEYTMVLATVLAECLPPGESGSISTVPLGFKQGWTADKHSIAMHQLCLLTEALVDLENNTGKHIRVCLEMEPACVLEKTSELIDFFSLDLYQYAINNGFSTQAIFRHLGACFDVCHQAVMFEDILESLTRIHNAGIAIGKIQFSNALRIHSKSDGRAKKHLSEFIEPRYLHQTSIRNADGSIIHYPDLQDALLHVNEEPGQEWRVHFHVPIQLATINDEGLCTTRSSLEDVLVFLSEHQTLKPHLEVETYTWQVLPGSLRPVDDHSLVAGICSELQYLQVLLRSYQLLDLNVHVTQKQA